jgi:hypothetical protein
LWNLEREHEFASYQHAIGYNGDEGRDSKDSEDAQSKCPSSNTFNAIVETNSTLKRVTEGIITNPPE